MEFVLVTLVIFGLLVAWFCWPRVTDGPNWE
jgi:hypothetical protein